MKKICQESNQQKDTGSNGTASSGESFELRKQRGFTTVEIIVGLVILAAVAIFIAGRVGLLRNVFGSTTESGEIDLLYNAVKGSKTSTGGYGTTGTDLAAMLVSTSQVPSNLTVSGTSIMNQWGDAYVITSQNLYFTLTDDIVPKGACVSTLESEGTNGNWSSISVNGTAVTLTGLSASTAASACSGDTNTMLFTTAN